ncbi:MAG: hypothetical protein KTR31_37840 [Myxococcales bacterium]|nr:hypothetical protein [Myxococcales bacterium]
MIVWHFLIGAAVAAPDGVLLWRDAPLFQAPDNTAASVQLEAEATRDNGWVFASRVVAERDGWLALSTRFDWWSCYPVVGTPHLDLELWVRREHVVPALAEAVTVDDGDVSVELLPGLAARRLDPVEVGYRDLRVALPGDTVVRNRFVRGSVYRVPPPTHTLAAATVGLVRVLDDVGVTLRGDGRPVFASRCMKVTLASAEGVREGTDVGELSTTKRTSGRAGDWQIAAGTAVVWPDGAPAGVVVDHWVRAPARTLLEGPEHATCFSYSWEWKLNQPIDLPLCVASDAITLTTKRDAPPRLFHQSELTIRRTEDVSWPEGQPRRGQQIRCVMRVTFDYRGRSTSVEARDPAACPEAFASEAGRALGWWKFLADPRANGYTLITVGFDGRTAWERSFGGG